MFLEMEGEFSRNDYPAKSLVKIRGEEDETTGIW
jgi:2-methylcitrate dehydratase PrpD